MGLLIASFKEQDQSAVSCFYPDLFVNSPPNTLRAKGPWVWAAFGIVWVKYRAAASNALCWPTPSEEPPVPALVRLVREHQWFGWFWTYFKDSNTCVPVTTATLSLSLSHVSQFPTYNFTSVEREWNSSDNLDFNREYRLPHLRNVAREGERSDYENSPRWVLLSWAVWWSYLLLCVILWIVGNMYTREKLICFKWNQSCESGYWNSPAASLHVVFLRQGFICRVQLWDEGRWGEEYN